MIWFILFLFVFKTYFVQYIVNLRIKCVTETRNVSVLFCKNLKSSFSNYMAHTFVSEVSLHSWLIWPMVWGVGGRHWSVVRKLRGASF